MENIRTYISGTAIPRFVSGIQSEATQSSIKISWSTPITYTNEIMGVDHYFITYTSGWEEMAKLEHCVKEAADTQLIVAHLDPNTYTLFTIAAEFQGRFGPQVSIGISTSNVCMLKQ